ncbi:MAG: helix-turn-helix transcriptional regulator [Clostridia bacterium]|nr:helix-turn-helix transcriptional regulator [Clostridia bacterium]
MKSIVAFSKNLKKQLEQKNLTVKQLSEQSGVSESTIRAILNGKIKNLQLKTAYYLCATLKITITEMSSE